MQNGAGMGTPNIASDLSHKVTVQNTRLNDQARCRLPSDSWGTRSACQKEGLQVCVQKHEVCWKAIASTACLIGQARPSCQPFAQAGMRAKDAPACCTWRPGCPTPAVAWRSTRSGYPHRAGHSRCPARSPPVRARAQEAGMRLLGRCVARALMCLQAHCCTQGGAHALQKSV